MTDWRDAAACEADSCFGRLHAFRHPFNTVTVGFTIVYPPRLSGTPEYKDEGCEFSIGFEKELADRLVGDVEFSRFFEFRGVDAEEGLARRGLAWRAGMKVSEIGL